jgi:hypothetical protein
MNEQIETCICLHYIGDNGPCPRHGDPPTCLRLWRQRRHAAHRQKEISHETTIQSRSQTPIRIPAPDITSAQAGR